MQLRLASPESCRQVGVWARCSGPLVPGLRVPSASSALLCPGPAGGSEAPPHPPSWRPAHRRAALPRKHATATCWGHQLGPRDPGLAGGDPSPPECVTPASSSVVCSARRTQHAHKTGNSPPRWRPRSRPHTRASRPWSIPSSPRPGCPCTELPPGPHRHAAWHELPGGCRDQSHSHLSVTWMGAGATPPLTVRETEAHGRPRAALTLQPGAQGRRS